MDLGYGDNTKAALDHKGNCGDGKTWCENGRKSRDFRWTFRDWRSDRNLRQYA